jgi:hypothetical protein
MRCPTITVSPFDPAADGNAGLNNLRQVSVDSIRQFRQSPNLVVSTQAAGRNQSLIAGFAKSCVERPRRGMLNRQVGLVLITYASVDIS